MKTLMSVVDAHFMHSQAKERNGKRTGSRKSEIGTSALARHLAVESRILSCSARDVVRLCFHST